MRARRKHDDGGVFGHSRIQMREGGGGRRYEDKALFEAFISTTCLIWPQGKGREEEVGWCVIPERLSDLPPFSAVGLKISVFSCNK